MIPNVNSRFYMVDFVSERGRDDALHEPSFDCGVRKDIDTFLVVILLYRDKFRLRNHFHKKTAVDTQT